jgi:hypothetical protein
VAQITHARRLVLTFIVGLDFFGTGIAWFLIVGGVFALLDGATL